MLPSISILFSCPAEQMTLQLLPCDIRPWLVLPRSSPLMHHPFTIPNPRTLNPLYASPTADTGRNNSPTYLHPFFSSRPGDGTGCRGHSLGFRPAQAASFGFAAIGTGFSGSCFSGEGERGPVVGVKDIDLATLGNLCVDIVLDVEELPPPSLEGRKVYMEKLSASPPDKRYWEAGGNCNTAIAAARLGLHCSALGHVGAEIYGQFLLNILHDEGIGIVGMNDDVAVDNTSDLYETLLCWVLVDPMRRHGFCSRADFQKEPAFSWMTQLSAEGKLTINRSKTIIFNGYGFDELAPSLLVSTLKYAVEAGSSIFFDPGPRGKSLASGTPEERRALSVFLQMSDVLLLTADEAESLIGIGNPIIAGQEFLKQSLRIKWVVIKMGARGSVIISRSSISYAPAFRVNVVDTVGCGDSFVAAVAFGYIHRLSLVNTLALANAVGAATALGCGAGRNVANLDKVIELMKMAKLNDDKIGSLLDNTELHCPEVTFLSSMPINGTSSMANRVSLQKSVSELLPMLESARLRSSVIS